MNVLLTGNLGYVGTVMSAYLQTKGHRVRGFDRGYFNECALEHPVPADEQVEGDVRSFDAAALLGIDAIVHLAGLSNDPLGELDPQLTHDVNVGGTGRLARAAKAAGIGRFVFASSCSMYGLADGTVALDETCPQNPLTAYALSKVEAEAALRELTDERFRPISLRFATAYGYSARLRLDLVVNNLVASALARDVVALESDGSPWRPLIHVEDMARAVECALEADLGRLGGDAYNAGTESENYQIIAIAREVAARCGGVPIAAKPPGGDHRSYNVAFGKIRAAFPSFRPVWTLGTGIDDLIARLRALGRTAIVDDDAFYRLRKIRALAAL